MDKIHWKIRGIIEIFCVQNFRFVILKFHNISKYILTCKYEFFSSLVIRFLYTDISSIINLFLDSWKVRIRNNRRERSDESFRFSLGGKSPRIYYEPPIETTYAEIVIVRLVTDIEPATKGRFRIRSQTLPSTKNGIAILIENRLLLHGQIEKPSSPFSPSRRYARTGRSTTIDWLVAT